jgi:hypothetical protein
MFIVPIDGLDGTTIEIEKEDTNISAMGTSMEKSSCTFVTKNYLFLEGYVFPYLNM